MDLSYNTGKDKRGVEILFESNDCFYLYSDETFDPETGGYIKGEFRDIYDRKK